MPTPDLADVIARVRKIVGRYHKDDNVISVDRPDLNAILDAAEAGMQPADRIAALEAERKWRPIETAPRDPNHVLAWQPGAYTPYIAYFFMGSWETDADQYNDSERYFPSDCQPTHWMPLAAPPLDDPAHSMRTIATHTLEEKD